MKYRVLEITPEVYQVQEKILGFWTDWGSDAYSKEYNINTCKYLQERYEKKKNFKPRVIYP